MPAGAATAAQDGGEAPMADARGGCQLARLVTQGQQHQLSSQQQQVQWQRRRQQNDVAHAPTDAIIVSMQANRNS